MSRTGNSLRNIRYAVIGQFVGILVSFVARTVFVRTLSAEYLGVNGLFANILTMLSIAELGIGTAIVFSMYEPLAHRDEPKLRALMRLYRKAYVTIGLVVAAVGAALIPALPFLVGELPEVAHIELIYLLFVADSSITYFFSYKRSFLIADQKRYIATIYRYSFFTALNVVQIIVLITTANYLLFLGTQVILTLLENVAVSRKVDRMYGFLSVRAKSELTQTDTSTIVRNVKAMILHRLGGAVLVGTDSIVMSRFAGIVAVGLYSNYLLIINALTTVFGIVFSSLTASVGNLSVEAPRAKQIETFRVIDLAVFLTYGWASVCLFVLFNPFISLWLGDEYVFGMPIVLAIAANFFLTGMRQSLWIFKDAQGIYWQDRYRPLAEIVVNLAVSIVLAQHIGVLGVLIGTAASTLLVCLPIEPYVLFRHGFAQSPRWYYVRYLRRTLLVTAFGALIWGLASLVPEGGWFPLLYRVLLCVIVAPIVLWAVFARSSEFGRLWTVATSRWRP